jgi:GGDEF domain-containing protein
MMMALLVRWLRRSMLELQASEAHAQHLASHDVLTGLPNRSLFDERLEQALGRTRRGDRLALLTLDLDRFKQVNDMLGHAAGDTLIREFAGRGLSCRSANGSYGRRVRLRADGRICSSRLIYHPCSFGRAGSRNG